MTQQDLEVQEKKELKSDAEQTEPGQYFIPQTDIHEADDALFITMDMPGVNNQRVDVQLEKNVLNIVGKVDLSNYEGLEPLYTEYKVGNYTRSFTLSDQIDQEGISASMEDGVLSLRLPKAKEAKARKIEVV